VAQIAVDIDSTLYDFETAAREAMLKKYYETKDPAYKLGVYHPWTEWRSPADAVGLKRWLTAIEVCHQADIIMAQVPFPGAVETCRALTDYGHSLLYISNRAEGSLDATSSWLEANGFLHEGAEVVATSGDKKPYMVGCQYLIDDRLKTCVEFIHDFDWQIVNGPRGTNPSRERKAFIKGYPYNQAATDIPGTYVALTWAGLNEYLVSKGVLPDEAYHALEAVA
jgi:hypothetical protein